MKQIIKKCNYTYAPRYDYGYQSIRFHLKQQKERMQPTQIMLSVRINNIRYRLYIRNKVEPAFWDTRRGLCKCDELLSPRVRTRMKRTNLAINGIRYDIHAADMHAAELGRTLSVEELRNIVLKHQDKSILTRTSGIHPVTTEKSVHRPGPLSVFRQIAGNFDTTPCNNGASGAVSSRKTYQYCLRRLEAFVRDSRFDLQDFSQLNRPFYHSFVQWLNKCSFQSGKDRKKYSAATVQNTLRCIINLHHKAFEAGYTDVPECHYESHINTGGSQTGKIYLSEKDLSGLVHLKDLSPLECEVRDMFILASYTALRFSDLCQLNEAVIADGSIRLFQKKTHGNVIIPLLKEIAGIVDKYSKMSSGFPRLNHGTANKIIKELCQRAGIDNYVAVREYRGGGVQIRNYPKYELVSFHTARRSCITNLFRRGYSPNYLMTMSGHKSISSFQRYVRTDNEELSTDFIKELKKRNAI